MRLDYSAKLLDILVENGSRIMRAHFGVDRAEATFFDIIELLREEPALKDHFLAMVEKTLEQPDPSGWREGQVPRELTELAAHELRWPEFKEIADKRAKRLFGGDAMHALGDVSDSIGEAYRDDWKDRMFYRRYGAMR